MFPRGYIAGRSLSKPVVLNLDNNAWVKSNSAGNFTEIYRQSLRGNTRLSKYGYKSNLSNSMTRRSEQRELSHKIDLIPPNVNVSIESKKIPITAFPPDYSRQPFFFFFFVVHTIHWKFHTVPCFVQDNRETSVTQETRRRELCVPPAPSPDGFISPTNTYFSNVFRQDHKELRPTRT